MEGALKCSNTNIGMCPCVCAVCCLLCSVSPSAFMSTLLFLLFFLTPAPVCMCVCVCGTERSGLSGVEPANVVWKELQSMLWSQ